MKHYRMIVHDSETQESQIVSIFLDPRKAYIESILYNLSDLENIDNIDTYPSQIKKNLEFLFYPRF
jgi:hypothetical protein